jgi:hypothetical protein
MSNRFGAALFARQALQYSTGVYSLTDAKRKRRRK